MSAKDILLKHVCPGVGVGIALIMFLSPYPAVQRCNKAKCLGELNALPFAAMAVNCAAWVFYAQLLKDFYIYFGNLPGMLLGLHYVLTCYKFSKEAAQDLLRRLLLAAVLMYWSIGLVSLAAPLDTGGLKTLWGSTAVAVLGVYYTAPLSSVAKVLAERDSSSLHWPLCSMNIINGLLWFAYGLALRDWFVSLPNGIGAGFNVVCLALCFIFPAKRRQQQQQEEQRQQARPVDVLEGINPASNWGALRLQSIARPPPGQDGSSEEPAASGGFFDLTQLRWRTGGSFRAGSFKSSSMLRLLSGRQEAHGEGAGGAAGAAGDDSSADAAVKVSGGKGLDQAGPEGAARLAEGGIKAGGGDIEQAVVVADGRQPAPDQRR